MKNNVMPFKNVQIEQKALAKAGESMGIATDWAERLTEYVNKLGIASPEIDKNSLVEMLARVYQVADDSFQAASLFIHLEPWIIGGEPLEGYSIKDQANTVWRYFIDLELRAERAENEIEMIHFGKDTLSQRDVEKVKKWEAVIQEFKDNPSFVEMDEKQLITYFDLSHIFTTDLHPGFVDYLEEEDLPTYLYSTQDNYLNQ